MKLAPRKPKEIPSPRNVRNGGVWLEKCGLLPRLKGKMYDARRAIWRIRWFDPLTGKRRSWSRQQWRKRDAKAAQAQVRAQLSEWTSKHRITWRKFVEMDLDWLDSHRRASTVEKYDLVYRYITNGMEPVWLDDVNYRLCELYIQQRLICNAPATANTDLRLLRAAWNRAIRRGWTTEVNPITQALFVDEVDTYHETVNPLEFARLVQAAPNLDWLTILHLGYHSGLRIGEILALENRDLYLDDDPPRLVIRNKKHHPTKSGHNRTIVASRSLMNHLSYMLCTWDLRQYRKGRIVKSTSLKPTLDTHPRASDGFRKICEQAGLTLGPKQKARFTLHDLRRSALTRWSKAGMDIADLKAVAGHSSIETTLKYYLTIDSKKQADIIGKE